jgi:hypothetical protein
MSQRSRVPWQARMRSRIEGFDYITKIHEYIMGENEMNQSQVNAMFSLLDRVMPKLSQQTLVVEREDHPRNMTLADLQAEWTGMMQAEGDCIINIPADFQVPLDLIPKMVTEWENGAKIVCLIKKSSEEHKGMWFIRQLYYWFYKKFSETQVLQGFTGSGLYDKSFLNLSRNIGDPIVTFFQQITELGYNIVKLPYQQPVRQKGKSKSNLWLLLDFAIIRFTNASSVGPHLATISGFLMAAISLLIAFAYLVAKLVWWQHYPAGIAPVLIGMFFIGAVHLFFIGLIGEYVLKANTRLMRYPIVIEEERLNFGNAPRKEEE